MFGIINHFHYLCVIKAKARELNQEIPHQSRLGNSSIKIEIPRHAAALMAGPHRKVSLLTEHRRITKIRSALKSCHSEFRHIPFGVDLIKAGVRHPASTPAFNLDSFPQIVNSGKIDNYNPK